MDLAGEHLPDALNRIAAWRTDAGASQTCPACQAPGLEIIDRSARPYSEWYALKCEACGLDAAIQIPLPGPVQY